MKTMLLSVTAEKICSAISHAYEIGDISNDLRKCIALLSSLRSDFLHLQSIITHNVSATTTSNPFVLVQLHAYLDGC